MTNEEREKLTEIVKRIIADLEALDAALWRISSATSPAPAPSSAIDDAEWDASTEPYRSKFLR